MTRDTRGGNGRYIRTPDTARRDAHAAELRGKGATYQRIADQLGYTDRSAARKAVERALADIVHEPAEELRHLQLAHLDEMTALCWDIINNPQPRVDHGRVITHDGQPLTDHDTTLKAIDRLVRICDHRARLLGLYAPKNTGGFDRDRIDAEIDDLINQLRDQ